MGGRFGDGGRGGDAGVDLVPDDVNFGIGELGLAGRHLAGDQFVEKEAAGGRPRNDDGASGTALEDGVWGAQIEFALRDSAVAQDAFGLQDRLHVLFERLVGGLRQGGESD